MAAFFGKGLVLQLNGCGTGPLIFPDSADHVDRVAEAGVSVAYQGHRQRGGGARRPCRHLRHGQKTHIRHPQAAGRLAVAGEIHAVKARLFHDFGAEGVISPRQHQDLRRLHQRPQLFSLFHSIRLSKN